MSCSPLASSAHDLLQNLEELVSHKSPSGSYLTSKETFAVDEAKPQAIGSLSQPCQRALDACMAAEAHTWKWHVKEIIKQVSQKAILSH
jgi:hypothetical protein